MAHRSQRIYDSLRIFAHYVGCNGFRFRINRFWCVLPRCVPPKALDIMYQHYFGVSIKILLFVFQKNNMFNPKGQQCLEPSHVKALKYHPYFRAFTYEGPKHCFWKDKPIFTPRIQKSRFIRNQTSKLKLEKVLWYYLINSKRRRFSIYTFLF